MRTFIVCSLLSLFLTSCGYRFGHGEVTRRYRSISIPYVEGDYNGSLTAALIHELAASGGLLYRQRGADLCLKVCLFKPEEENIGYIFAPKENGKNVDETSNILVSNEARVTLISRVSVVDRCTGCSVLGPIEIPTSLAFDFEPDLSNLNFLDFSLGQLQMYNLAKDTAFPSLFEQLAKKIVDYVNHGW